MTNPVSTQESPTILLIDDDHVLREACKLEMIAQGYVVLEADSFRSAEAILRHHHTIVDRVVCDGLLPGEAVENIRHICEALNLPCVLVSQLSEWKALLI